MTDVDVPMKAQAALRQALAELVPPPEEGSVLTPELLETAFARIATVPYTGDIGTYIAAMGKVAEEVILPVFQARKEQWDRELEADRVEQERRAANAAAFAEKLRQYEAFRDYSTSTTVH